MFNQESRATDEPEDDQLIELVEEISAVFQSGLAVDLDEYVLRFPNQASRLRQWAKILATMTDLGNSIDLDRKESCSSFDHYARHKPGHRHGTAFTDTPVFGVLGDFRLLREIGRGGMGVVYEAEQVSICRRVALKVLPFAAILDQHQLDRFRNESRAAGALNHTNIVSVYSVGCERGIPYYAMQLVEGRSLAELIGQLRQEMAVSNRHPSVEAPDCGIYSNYETDDAALATNPLSERGDRYKSIAKLAIQAAEALDHAHQNGILHRDVKPANLLFDNSGKLYITDFGLARIDRDIGLTMTGELLGTLRYTSPEQALGRRAIVDQRSDIYSLGVTLYELVSLEPARRGEDRHTLMRQIAFEEPMKLRRINPDIPMDLETIIHKAIERTIHDRYPTAFDLAEDLRRFVCGQPILAKPDNLVQIAKKWANRHQTLVWSLVMLLAVATCALAFANILIYRKEKQLSAQLLETQASRQRLDRHFRDALHIVELLIQHENAEDLGSGAAVTRMRNASTAGVEGYLNEFLRDDSLAVDTALHRGIANIHAGRLYEATRQSEKAIRSYRIAIDQFNTIVAKSPQDPVALHELAVSEHILATYFSKLGQSTEAQVHYREYQVCQNRYRHLPLSVRGAQGDRLIEEILCWMQPVSTRSELPAREDEWRALVEELAEQRSDWTEIPSLHFCAGIANAIVGNDRASKLAFEKPTVGTLDARTLNRFAWIFATAPSERARDGDRAVDLALQACEKTTFSNASHLDTLAAAYAEFGDFKSAVDWSKKAVELGGNSGELRKHLECFEQGMPWRHISE